MIRSAQRQVGPQQPPQTATKRRLTQIRRPRWRVAKTTRCAGKCPQMSAKCPQMSGAGKPTPSDGSGKSPVFIEVSGSTAASHGLPSALSAWSVFLLPVDDEMPLHAAEQLSKGQGPLVLTGSVADGLTVRGHGCRLARVKEQRWDDRPARVERRRRTSEMQNQTDTGYCRVQVGPSPGH